MAFKGEKTPIFLVGATGTGKSAAALELARSWAERGGAAILAMDAMQIYRGAEIGTSKPSAAERAEVPHGGLDLVEFREGFDVAHYLRHAADFLREQAGAGRRVVIVGGTGLYFRALTQGLCEAPQGAEALRAELSRLSTGELRERLGRVDPEMLTRVDRANPRRLARAIEVMESTGRSLRAWQEETPEPLVREYTAFWLQRPKAELEARLAARVEAMFAQGWVEEVRGLVARHGLAAVRGFAGIGYGEIAEMAGEPGQNAKFAELTKWATTGGGETEAVLKRAIFVATRQYAKRQLTWFRRESNLREVMLSGPQPFSAVHPALL